MRTTYGGFPLGEINSARFTWQRNLLRNAAGVGYGYAWRVDFGEVLFRSSSQAECRALMSATGAALSYQGGDLVVWNDDGTPSDNAVLSAATLSGVRCTFLGWLDRPGAQFLTHRLFACAFEWETAFAGTAFLLLDFKETLTIRGGTQRLVGFELINGPPVVQQTVPQTLWRATQSGQATGYLNRPIPGLIAPPVFPDAVTDQTVSFTGGDRVGANYRNFPVQWSYEYVSATPLIGFPTEWVG